jgi:hypothetical protein
MMPISHVASKAEKTTASFYKLKAAAHSKLGNTIQASLKNEQIWSLQKKKLAFQYLFMKQLTAWTMQQKKVKKVD